VVLFNGSKATTNAGLCHFNYEKAFRDVTIEKWQRRIISINLPKHNYLQYSCVCVCAHQIHPANNNASCDTESVGIQRSSQ